MAEGTPLQLRDHEMRPRDRNRANGRAILRVVADLRQWLEGQEVPTSLLDDLKAAEEVGNWLAGSTTIEAR